MPKSPRPILAFAVAAVVAAALPARAEEATFDGSVAGIRVGSLVMQADAKAGRYEARSRLDTAGVLGFFLEFFFDGRSTGSLDGSGRVVPARYDAKSKSPRALRTTVIEWKNGTPVKVSVEPPRSSAPDPAKQGGTLDPVAGGFRLLRTMPVAEVCDTTIRIFDGSRLSQIELAKPVASGDTLTCAGNFARIEGEAQSLTSLRRFPFSLAFRKVGSDAVLQRIEAPTNYGMVVLTRRG